MHTRIAIIFEFLILFMVFALVYCLSSKLTDFKPSSLAENANTIVSNIKDFLGGNK